MAKASKESAAGEGKNGSKVADSPPPPVENGDASDATAASNAAATAGTSPPAAAPAQAPAPGFPFPFPFGMQHLAPYLMSSFAPPTAEQAAAQAAATAAVAAAAAGSAAGSDGAPGAVPNPVDMQTLYSRMIAQQYLQALNQANLSAFPFAAGPAANPEAPVGASRKRASKSDDKVAEGSAKRRNGNASPPAEDTGGSSGDENGGEAPQKQQAEADMDASKVDKATIQKEIDAFLGIRWTDEEVKKLLEKVSIYGRNAMDKVSEAMGEAHLTPFACALKTVLEIVHGRALQKTVDLDPGSALWTDEERSRLYEALMLHGSDWKRVAQVVGSRTSYQCTKRVIEDMNFKVRRSAESVPKRWTSEELARLNTAIHKFGRDWPAVSRAVGGGRSEQDCRGKLQKEIVRGRMLEPGGKRERSAWTEEETRVLRDAVQKYGKQWNAVAQCLPNRTKVECALKAGREVNRGRLVMRENE